jgi:hypothetical protein
MSGTRNMYVWYRIRDPMLQKTTARLYMVLTASAAALSFESV